VAAKAEVTWNMKYIDSINKHFTIIEKHFIRTITPPYLKNGSSPAKNIINNIIGGYD